MGDEATESKRGKDHIVVENVAKRFGDNVVLATST